MNELIDDRVREQLHEALGTGPVVHADWADVDRRLGAAVRRRRRQRLGAATAVVVLAAVVLVTARGSTREPVRTGRGVRPVATTTTTTGTTTSTAAPLDAAVHVVSRTQIFAPGVLVATDDGAWSTSGIIEGGAPTVVHVSSAGRVLSTTSLPGVIQGPVYLASGEGSIWAAAWDGGTLFRIDPRTGRVTKAVRLSAFQVTGEVEGIAAGFGHVYVTMCCVQPAGPDQVLLQLDPGLTTLQGRIGLRGAGENERVTVGGGVVLVTGEGLDKVQVIDPANLLGHEVGVLGGAGPLTASDTVWVIDRWFAPSGAGFGVSRLDPVALTSHQVATFPEGIGQVSASGDVLWARGQYQHGRIFVVTGTRVREVPGTETTAGGVIAARGDRLWAFEGGELVQYQRG